MMSTFSVGALGMAAAIGLGNGAVFKLVPECFPGSVGSVTDLVGAAGGLGGFYPPRPGRGPAVHWLLHLGVRPARPLQRGMPAELSLYGRAAHGVARPVSDPLDLTSRRE